MKSLITSMLILIAAVSVKAQSDIKVYPTFDEFSKEILEPKDSNETYVINFWATWCRPCVQELPLFDSLGNQDSSLNIVLVSLDFGDSPVERVKKLLNKKNITQKTVLFTDGNTNKWIDLIDPNWSGAIPFTIIKKGDKTHFYEKQYHNLQELKTDIKKIQQ
ncbi:MAG: TlpA disulfide reductase family protein [Bacteroidia bacterium]